MGFDILFIALLALFMLIGLFQGVVNQIFRLVGLVAIWVYIHFFSERTAAFIAEKAGLSEISAYLWALIAGVILIYLVFVILGMIVTRLTTAKDETAKHTNAFLGATLGLVKGVFVAGLVFCVLDILPDRAFKTMPEIGTHLHQSLIIRAIDTVNPLRDFRFLLNLAAYADVLKDEKALRALEDQKPMIELQNNNDVLAVINDPTIQQLIQDRKLLQLLANPKVRKLLADPQVRTLLNQIDPQAALDAARSAPVQPPVGSPSK